MNGELKNKAIRIAANISEIEGAIDTLQAYGVLSYIHLLTQNKLYDKVQDEETSNVSDYMKGSWRCLEELGALPEHIRQALGEQGNDSQNGENTRR